MKNCYRKHFAERINNSEFLFVHNFLSKFDSNMAHMKQTLEEAVEEKVLQPSLRGEEKGEKDVEGFDLGGCDLLRITKMIHRIRNK